MPKASKRIKATTPVDDVRRVRERLSRAAGGDVRKLAAGSMKVFERFRDRLGLKLVDPPPSKSQRRRA